MDNYLILAVNPGSTSTKIALYENDRKCFDTSLSHDQEELEGYRRVLDQFAMRKDCVLKALEDNGVDRKKLSCVVGRGGMLPPVSAGGYIVNGEMVEVLKAGSSSEHVSNLGALIAKAIAAPLQIPAYIYDAVSSDELDDVARITGIPEVVRQSFCHVLNSKATARKAAEAAGKRYEDFNAVVAHIGGGISISAHKKGRIVDVITADGGPFSPERSGSVPLTYIVDMCYSGCYTKAQMLKKIAGMGGLKAYLGTHDCRKIEEMIAAGDERAKLLYEAQAYQIAKGIGELSPVLKGELDFIILTGGMAYSGMLTEQVRERVSFLGPVVVMPGENELEALALGALRILEGKEKAHEFVLTE